ncbi:MAG: prolipoprotein diacylglyceryl transferase [Defluviitaleaceae bacterium]|nr:prolipoprotein diacylglyceryl transferase [Defluviitaleaceae bacterium]
MPDIVFPNLGISFETINRVAFTVFGIEIYWYAIAVVLGIIAGVFFGAYVAPKSTGQNPVLYTDFALWVIIACIIGGRLFYVIFSWDATWTFWDIFAIRDGGIAIFGVIITAIFVAWIYTKVKKLDFLNFADTGIVGLIIGHVIGRFGNFINREAFGGWYDGLFAMEIRLDQVLNRSTVTQEMLDNPVMRNGITYVSVHPTFLYEATINLTLFIFLNFYRKHKKFNGELLAYYFLVYGVARFFLEGLRTDQLILFNTGVPVSQLVSALLIVAGIALLAWGFINRHKAAKTS